MNSRLQPHDELKTWRRRSQEALRPLLTGTGSNATGSRDRREGRKQLEMFCKTGGRGKKSYFFFLHRTETMADANATADANMRNDANATTDANTRTENDKMTDANTMTDANVVTNINTMTYANTVGDVNTDDYITTDANRMTDTKMTTDWNMMTDANNH